MKRLIALIGVALLLIGLRYYDDGIRRFTYGRLTAYDNTDAGYVVSEEVFLPTGADSYRIDLDAETDIEKFLDDCMAKIIFLENEGSIIYAYSPMIPRSVWIHGNRVNIMIHKGETAVNIGVPVLKGSY